MGDIPAEVLFHRYFQTNASPYCGKFDIEAQPPNVRSVLAGIQESYNQLLRGYEKGADHAHRPPFYLDYIDSSIENAHAFRYEGYSFIGITVGLISTIAEICARLSKSRQVAASCGVQLSAEGCDALNILFLRTMLNFVVSHEYAHHVHGDVFQLDSNTAFLSEISAHQNTGDIEDQTMELDADAYSSTIVLANLIDGGERSRAIRPMQLEAEPAGIQDEVLYSSFVVAVGGYLFERPPTTLDRLGVYKLTHPPQSMRMNFLMLAADSWCKQKRPALLEWMTAARFELLMTSAAEVAWGMNGGRDWAAQVAFILSEDGEEYRKKLHQSLKRRFESRRVAHLAR